ncbi:MAG: hypothetical protein IKH16_02135 [Selenomonadaceae bacterium]|nr:hypothetical protein [Selenomonadaceae bacterium]
MEIFSEDELRDFLQSSDGIAIYGTGGMGGNLYQYLRRNDWLGKLLFFVVREKTQEDFEGVAVKELHGLTDEEKLATVVIATRQNFHEEIIRDLEGENIWDYHTMSEDVLNLIERLAIEMPEDDGAGEKREETAAVSKENRACTGRGIQSICDLHAYLKELAAHANEWVILLAIRDTVGLELDAEINRQLMALGTRNIHRKHWRGYAFVSCEGEVLANELGKTDKSVSVSLEVRGLSVDIESCPYKDGNKAVIRVGGHDYSMNSRGLNIVVIDPARNRLVDSVGFDTHTKNLACSRSEIYLVPEDVSRPRMEPVASGFADERLPEYRYAAGVKSLRRSLSAWEAEDAKEQSVLAFFREMCHREEPVVLSGERISWFSSVEDVPVERLLRGMARKMGFPMGEACRMAENVSPDFGMLLERGIGRMPEGQPSREVEICRELVLSLAARYEEEAQSVGNEIVAESLRQVPAHPARSFVEALQYVRFVSAMLRLAGHGEAVPGRMDQYLYPYWKGDLEAGRLSEQEAGDLLREFLASISRGGEIPAVTLGGCHPDGRHAFNGMTRKILELAADGKLPPVVLILRVPAEMPEGFPELAERCHGLHRAVDSEILGMLVAQGIPEDVARGYAVASQGEIVFPGQVRRGRLDGEISFPETVREAGKEFAKGVLREEAEGILRDEMRIRVLGMLSYQVIRYLSSPVLELFSVRWEDRLEGADRFHVPYRGLEEASHAWTGLLQKAGISVSEEAAKFLEECLAEACDRFSMFNKALLPEVCMGGDLS